MLALVCHLSWLIIWYGSFSFLVSVDMFAAVKAYTEVLSH